MARPTVWRSRAEGSLAGAPRRPAPDDDNPAGASASVRTRRIREFARDVLGFEEFRPGQEAAMQAVVAGRDTLAVLPSGAGKTAIYQVAGQLLDGPVVVVSPLIALQRDQVERLAEIEDRAGRAAQLNSTLSAGDQREVLESLRDGTVRFVFLAPEQLTKPEVVDAIRDAGRRCSSSTRRTASPPGATTSGPTTCASGGVIEQLGHPTVLALTATAAPPVRAEIVERLEMRDPEIVVAGFDRPEIRLEVDHHADAHGKEQGVLDRVLAEIGEGRGPGHRLQRHPQGHRGDRRSSSPTAACAPGTTTRASARPTARTPSGPGWTTSSTSSSPPPRSAWASTSRTPASSIHAEPADSVDSYYQEIGRAGRDGEPALAVLVYRQEDLGLRRFFAAGTPAEEELQQVAGLVAAAAAAGHRGRRRRQGPARGDRPGRHPAGPRPQPARAGVGRRPGRRRRRAPGRGRARPRRGGRGGPRAGRAPRAGRPEPRRDDARLRRDHRLPAPVPARLLRRAARRALRQLRQLLRRHGPGAARSRRPRRPRSRSRRRSSTASGARAS